MAVDLVATVGAADANSYVDLDRAAAEMNLRLNSDAWNNAANDDTRKRALIEATRLIDNNRFSGYRATGSQRLEFPRNCQREPITDIPDDVIQAVLDQALALLAPSPEAATRADLQAQGVASFTTGSHSETFGPKGANRGGLCSQAVTRLSFWLCRTGAIIGPRETPVDPRGGSQWWPFL